MIRPDGPLLRIVTSDEIESHELRLADFVRGPMTKQILSKLAPGTADKYEQMLAHWGKLTQDPWLTAITDEDVQAFADQLKTTTYKRGRFGLPRSLSVESRNSILRCLRAALNAAAGRAKRAIGKKEPQILPAQIPVPMERSDLFPADSLTADQLRATVIEAMKTPGDVAGAPWSAWWQLAYALGFYAACRLNEMLSLEWEHVRLKRGIKWLYIPGGITKVKKARRVVCHRLLSEALDAWPAPKVGIILKRECVDDKFVNKRHQRFQRAAGVPAEEISDWHSLRNSVAEELTLLGARESLEAARQQLGHAHQQTTERHYLRVDDVLIPFLPNLWEPTAPASPG